MRRRFIYAVLELVAHDAQAALCYSLECAECIREEREEELEQEWECLRPEYVPLLPIVKVIE